MRRVLSAFFGMVFGMLLGIAIGLLFVLYVLVLYLWSGEAPFAAHRTTFLSTVVLYLGGGIVAGAIAGLLGPLGRGPFWAAFVGFVAALPVAWACTQFLIADMTHQVPTALLSALALGVPVGLIYRRLFGDWFREANEDGAST